MRKPNSTICAAALVAALALTSSGMLLLGQEPTTAPAVLSEGSLPADRTEDPAAAGEASETRERVRAAVASLPDGYRVVVTLRFFDFRTQDGTVLDDETVSGVYLLQFVKM